MREIICKDMAEVAAAIKELPEDVVVTVVFQEEGEENVQG